MLKNYITHLRAGWIILLLLLVNPILGQKMNNTLYLMQNVPQSNLVNPAIQPECKVFVGVPALSSIYYNYSNSSFAYSDLIHKGSNLRSDSLVIDINKFHDALKTSNFISQQTDLSILALGIRAKSFYFTLDLIERNSFNFQLNKEVFTFVKNGNWDYRGRTADFGPVGLDAAHYRELALGVSKKLNEKWTVGAKAKVLFGIANMNMDNSDVSIYTSQTGDLVRLHSKQLLNVSLPINQIEKDANGFVDNFNFDGNDYDAGFFLNTKNKGLALDLGMTYQADEKTTLYASIIDLGYINWKTDTYQFYQDATFDYSGADLSQSGNSNDPNYREAEDVFEELIDDLQDEFRVLDDASSYKTGLPTQIYFGGTHQIHKRVNIGALSRTEIFNKKIHSSLTFSANARLIKNFSTSLSYSVVNNTYDNIGFGFAGKLGPVQLYMVSDFVLAPIHPENTQNFNFRFGLNLLFGCKDKTVHKNSCNFEEDSYQSNNKKKRKRKKKKLN